MAWPIIAAAGISALGSYLGGQGQANASKDAARTSYKQWEAQQAIESQRRAAAREALQGYSYQSYSNPILSQYLSGQLSNAQQAQIAQNQRVGEASIARRSAGMGMPSGAQAGLYGQLSRDISLGAGKQVADQQNLGLQYSMADWVRQQEAAMQNKQLLAQYAG